MFKSVFKTGIVAHYSVSSNPSFVAEPWSVYPAKHRSSSRKVSVFIFDKKKFESVITQLTGSSKSNKVLYEDAYTILKATISNLAKFKHPNILTIIENIEEHKANIMFVTEYVVGSLGSVGAMEDVIIQKGILQLSKGLDFFHSNCAIIHSNIQPHSVFINENSDWKLSGLGFIKNMNELTSDDLNNFYLNNYDARMPHFLSLNLNYTAPEIVFDNNLSINNDVFSLGCLIYYLYNGETFIKADGSTNYYKEEYKKFELKFNHQSTDMNFFYKKIPDILHPIFPKLTARYPYDRISIQDFLASPYFNNPLIKSLIFIDEFPSKTEDEKLIFLKGLINLIPLFPNQLLQQKFLPLLVGVVDSKIETGLIPVTLRIILIIGKTLSNLTFHDKITPTLFKVIEFPEAQLVLIEDLEILNKKMNKKELLELLKPLTERILAPQVSPHLQEQFLDKLELVVDLFDFPYVKNELFPKICSVFAKTTSLSIKVCTINTFKLLVTHKTIDRYIIEESLLPLLKKLKTREAVVLLSLLEFYNQTSEVLENSVIVEEIIPQLWKLSISNTLTINQYKDYLKIMKKLESKIETRQLEILGELHKDDGDHANNFAKLIYSEQPKSIEGPQESVIQPNRVLPMKQTTTIKPLQLKPKKSFKSSNPTGLSFGSASNQHKIIPMKNSLDDEFGDFTKSVSDLPMSVNLSSNNKNVTLMNTAVSKDISASGLINAVENMYSTNVNMNNVSGIKTINSGIDWSTENKAKSDFPPGFSMQLLPSSKPKATSDFSLI